MHGERTIETYIQIRSDQSLSRVRLFATPGHVACQTPLSMEEEEYFLQGVYISKQEYWSGLPFPSPEHLPDPGIEPLPPEVEAQNLNHWTTSCC